MASKLPFDPRGMVEASISSAKQLASVHAAQEAMAQAEAKAEFTRSAGGAAEALFNQIKEFEARTDRSMEVGVQLVSFGQAVTFSVTGVGYTQPNLIWFEGSREDGSSVRLVQHFSQLSFLLMRIPRPKPETPRKPIGFHQ